VGGIFAHRLEKRMKEQRILLFIPLLITTMFWFILIEPIMVVPFVILGILDSVFYVVLIDYINKLVVSKERATVLSFFGMMFSVVMIVIFTIIGYIIESFGFDTAFVLLAVIVTIFNIVLFIVLQVRQKNQIES